MQSAVVQGRATSTVKHASLEACKLLVCGILDVDGRATGDPVLVLDRLGAGLDDRVIISSDGLGLRALLGDGTSPARWWTVGLIDEKAGSHG